MAVELQHAFWQTLHTQHCILIVSGYVHLNFAHFAHNIDATHMRLLCLRYIKFPNKIVLLTKECL